MIETYKDTNRVLKDNIISLESNYKQAFDSIPKRLPQKKEEDCNSGKYRTYKEFISSRLLRYKRGLVAFGNNELYFDSTKDEWNLFLADRGHTIYLLSYSPRYDKEEDILIDRTKLLKILNKNYKNNKNSKE